MNRIFLLLCMAASVTACTDKTAKVPTPAEVLSVIGQVNGYWQRTHPQPQTAFWHEAAYHTGNMEVFRLTGDTACLAFTERWAEHNNWCGATGNDRKKWRYDYGETPDHVLFGDWQICFQNYLDLYGISPAPERIARAVEVMSYQTSTNTEDYLWWADGLYMVMPVLTKMYRLTGNRLYLDKMHAYWTFARHLMYDEESCLFYRDAKYLYPIHTTDSGKKDFWARGNGWITAALARILQELPADAPNREEYIGVFKDMMSAVVHCQQSEGYWSRSLLDEPFAPGYETSGTAFFTYALLWGINNGILDAATFEPAALKAWNYLTQIALQPDGRIGYVQPIGERAIPGQQVNTSSTADFGVGALLLAACEMVRFSERNGK